MRKTLLIKRKAHYYIQEPKGKINSILIVIHGYGQLAEDFIKEFNSLKETPILVIAPEAISKFYNKERKAVANWMTSHERLDEIEDYCNYLDQLLELIKQEYTFNKIGVLGFSQGTSTAFRWVAKQKKHDINLYLCAGSIPPEINTSDFKNHSPINLNFYYGDDDKLFNETKAEEDINKLKSLELIPKIFQFQGRHEIPLICLEHIKEDL